MRVLITGHRGYVGSVLAGYLRSAHFEVVGLDADLYRGADLGRVSVDVPEFVCDFRDVTFADLLSFDAVVHLAALSDDTSGEIDAHLTTTINHAAAVRFALECRRAGVSRFLFASSCSVYGRGGLDLLSEDAPPNPRSAYAASKLACENDLLMLAGGDFCPVALRLATVYGMSPRLRMDTVVNELTGAAVTSGRVNLKSSGTAWRPLVHVEDVARAFAAALLADVHDVRGRVFNVAPQGANHRVMEIADAIVEWVPDCVRGSARQSFDSRSYRVDGSRLLEACPTLKFRWTLPQGIRQLRAAMIGAGLTFADWRSDRFRRAPRLHALQERGKLDGDLRRRNEVAV
ncbi:MAG: SDR family oxidoreductase [Phycisphaerae bacterium]|nr:SDR family oxidoreductase [Phycisphaerae bacterium]